MSADEYIPYSRRQAIAVRGGTSLPYQTGDLPRGFRNQVIHIWRRALGRVNYHDARGSLRINELWGLVHNLTAEEHGIPYFYNDTTSHDKQCEDYLLRASVDLAVDLIEVSFRVISQQAAEVYSRAARGITQEPIDAIADLNRRLKEHGIGFQFVGNRIIKLDSEYTHAEIVEPAIVLLHDASFTGATDEFMKAHEHYRHGRNKEAATEALKAVESTMKAIAEARGWTYAAHFSAGQLIALMMRQGLLPERLQRQFEQIEQLLVGLATVRNTSGGHGQGSSIVETPDYLAAYALHQAAANIVLLVEAHKALP